MFRGESSIVLDDKGRLAIPKGYREILETRWGKPAKLTLTIGLTPDIREHRWLVAHPAPEWESYEAKLNEVPPFDWEARKVVGLLIGHANDCDLDRQGRIVIPPSLREFAALGTRVKIVGQGREFELWNETKRNEWREASLASIGKILADPSPGLLAISR